MLVASEMSEAADAELVSPSCAPSLAMMERLQGALRGNEYI